MSTITPHRVLGTDLAATGKHSPGWKGEIGRDADAQISTSDEALRLIRLAASHGITIARLQSDIADLASVRDHHENEAKDLRAKVAALDQAAVIRDAELAEARKDTVRLDWCLRYSTVPAKCSDGMWDAFMPDEDGGHEWVGHGGTPRAAIDDAISRGAK